MTIRIKQCLYITFLIVVSQLPGSYALSTTNIATITSNDQLSSRIISLTKSNKPREAIDLYYNAWNNYLSSSSQSTSSSSSCSRMRPSTRVMNYAIQACARKSLTKEANRVFQLGMDNGLKPNVYTFGSLMRVYAKEGDTQKCTSLLQEMKTTYHVKPNSVVYSTAISACERHSPIPNGDLALQLLKDAVWMKRDDMDGFMNIVGYNAAISVLAKAGNWKTALLLLDEMGGKDLQSSILCIPSDQKYKIHIPKPDEVTYGTVMAACERAKEWRQVLNLCNQMQKERLDLHMDGISITSAIHACQQLGLGTEALSYLHTMKEMDTSNTRTTRHNRAPLQGPDSVAYRLVISACAKEGLVHEIQSLLHEMKEKGMTPDVMAYTVAIGGLAEKGKYLESFDLLKEMKKNNVKPNVITYSAAIAACASASAIAAASNREEERLDTDSLSDAKVQAPMKAALTLLLHMKNESKEGNKTLEPNIVTYNAAIRACAEAMNPTRAFALFDDLISRKLKPTVVTYGTLMTACERVGDIDGADRVFRSMKDVALQPNEIIYGAAISCCRKAGHSERALLLLRKMLELDLNPNAATFNTVLMAQIESKSVERSCSLIQLMASQRNANSRPTRQTYNILINFLAVKGEPSKAEHYLNLMRKDGFKPDVDLFTVIVSAYERKRDPISALNLMESMRADGYDFYEMKLLDAAFKQGVKVINNVVKKGQVYTTEYNKYGNATAD